MLKTVADPASETSCVLKHSGDGQSPKTCGMKYGSYGGKEAAGTRVIDTRVWWTVVEGKVVPVYTMKACGGSGGTAPLILTNST